MKKLFLRVFCHVLTGCDGFCVVGGFERVNAGCGDVFWRDFGVFDGFAGFGGF